MDMCWNGQGTMVTCKFNRWIRQSFHSSTLLWKHCLHITNPKKKKKRLRENMLKYILHPNETCHQFLWTPLFWMNQGTSCNLSSIKWFNKHVKLLYLKLDSIYGSHPRKWTRLYNWVRRIHVWKQKKTMICFSIAIKILLHWCICL